MPRRNRKFLTVPRGSAEDWAPLTADQRRLVENAYGQGPLGPMVWLKIETANVLFTSGAVLEDAIPISDFVSKLGSFQAAASEVKKSLPEWYGTKDPLPAGLSGAQKRKAIHETYFQVPDFDPTQPFIVQTVELLSHAVQAIDEICALVITELQNSDNRDLRNDRPPGGSRAGVGGRGYVHGTMWSHWVCWLTAIMKEHNLTYGARNDSDKRKNEMSPFVLLVHELQKHFSEKIKSTIQSRELDALARAINRARHGRKIDYKFVDGFEQNLRREGFLLIDTETSQVEFVPHSRAHSGDRVQPV
jgi:hypothetical protein